MRDPLLTQHSFVFNKKDNGGEQLILSTKFYDNGDGIPSGIYTIQELTLNSYGNAANFILSGCITPESLRELANELDAARAKLLGKSLV
jgi:hypothetical protein